MRNIAVILVFWIVGVGCTNKPKSTLRAETARLLPEPDLKERLVYQKTLIDTLFSSSKGKMRVLVKRAGKKEPVQAVQEQRPEGIENTFMLLTDSTGKVLRISEFPATESGDWSVMYSHYFDAAGNTFAHERRVSALNTFCPGEPNQSNRLSTETIVRLYNSAHQLLDSTYRLTDDRNQELTGKKCRQEVESDRLVYSSIDLYTNSKGINTGR